ncbi:MAG: RcnB family protein [Pseudomonadota bacterium]
MRKFLISAAILSLLGAAPLAMAQDRDHRGSDGNNPAANGHNAIGERQFREHRDAPSPQRVAQPAQSPADAAARTMGGVNRSLGNQPNAGRSDSGPRDNDAGRRDNSRGQRDNDAGRRDNNNRRDFDRSGPDRRDVRRPDFNNGRGDRRRDYSNFRNYHQNFRAPRRFRAPSYRRPPGFYARRWSWGETLPISFWARDYWLTDFYAYDLPPPPYGAVWVRVGEDALLIDQDSGEIIEVDYGVFY